MSVFSCRRQADGELTPGCWWTRWRILQRTRTRYPRCEGSWRQSPTSCSRVRLTDSGGTAQVEPEQLSPLPLPPLPLSSSLSLWASEKLRPTQETVSSSDAAAGVQTIVTFSLQSPTEPRVRFTHTLPGSACRHTAHTSEQVPRSSPKHAESPKTADCCCEAAVRGDTHTQLLSVCVCVCVQEVKVCRCADNTAAPSHRAPWTAVCTGACVCARTQNSCIENQEVSRGVDKADRQLRENNCRGTHSRTHTHAHTNVLYLCMRLDAGNQGAEGPQHPLKGGYDICRIYKKVQLIKNMLETELFILQKVSQNPQTRKNE